MEAYQVDVYCHLACFYLHLLPNNAFKRVLELEGSLQQMQSICSTKASTRSPCKRIVRTVKTCTKTFQTTSTVLLFLRVQ